MKVALTVVILCIMVATSWGCGGKPSAKVTACAGWGCREAIRSCNQCKYYSSIIRAQVLKDDTKDFVSQKE